MNYLENLQMGTFGWLHPSWEGTFYPEDMPSEWYFEFYANAYHVVLVPQEQWMTWQGHVLHALAGDLGLDLASGFRFYLAVDSDLNDEKVQVIEAILNELSPALAGLVLFNDVKMPTLPLPTTLQNLSVTLVSKNYKLPGWCWQTSGVWVSGAPLGYVFTLPAQGKQQAALLKDFKASLPPQSNGVVFIVGGLEVDMLAVANAKTVNEFLGY
ncbi:hypothetical protein [Thiomicrorhabdus aquaedulcis]|uniref:hypothetical protein n=1 Tax=Thiomicrorhabdus aquaedulcis TaxID=2211106 RepID=UPI000FDAD550|nr:hypothetical protein [Thiomicrorhabdus aquaedulcis]